ncbi:MAG: hypothetical protein ABSA85_01915 [Terracidiphilus sp.]|jgi:cobyrinic acid a,c-diamide synthase
MAEDESKLPVETLISMAGNSHYTRDSEITQRYLGLAEAKMHLESIALTKRNQEIAERQLDVSNEANALTKKLLISNEKASKQNEENALLMNGATQQLATSTRSLNRATWILVVFTAVQAFVAAAALYISITKMQGKCS